MSHHPPGRPKHTHISLLARLRVAHTHSLVMFYWGVLPWSSLLRGSRVSDHPLPRPTTQPTCPDTTDFMTCWHLLFRYMICFQPHPPARHSRQAILSVALLAAPFHYARAHYGKHCLVYTCGSRLASRVVYGPAAQSQAYSGWFPSRGHGDFVPTSLFLACLEDVQVSSTEPKRLPNGWRTITGDRPHVPYEARHTECRYSLFIQKPPRGGGVS